MKPITKDQAVDILQTLIPKDRKREARDQKADALEMAIRALRKDTATDCIDRRAVSDLIYNSWKQMGNQYGELSIDQLNELPSAKPEPIHGEWLIEGESGDYYCDRCGYIVPPGAEEDAENWNYCPSCGARMTEEEE